MEGLARLDERMLGGIVTVGDFVVRDEIYDEVKAMTDIISQSRVIPDVFMELIAKKHFILRR